MSRTLFRTSISVVFMKRADDFSKPRGIMGWHSSKNLISLKQQSP